MMPPPIEAAALDYRRRGWSVIPLRPRDKRPLFKWLAFQGRHAEDKEIADWFTACPDCNLGVVTGRISGLAVLDIDAKHAGETSFRQLTAMHGRTPPTVEVRTGGGGRHLYFAVTGEAPGNRVGLAEGIDLRGEGGYVVAPPSVHPGGGIYRWRHGRAPGDLPLAVLPGWLERLASDRDGPSGHSLPYWRALVRGGVAEGQRNNTIASLCGHLLWHGIDPSVALDLLLCWNRVRCRPPLADEEVARVVASITRLHERPKAQADTTSK